jgi:hypothetical protein
MQHLLAGDSENDAAPPLDRCKLLRRDTLVDALLEGEGGEEVLAHEPVLELGCLAEHVEQGLAVLDHERTLAARVRWLGNAVGAESAAEGRRRRELVHGQVLCFGWFNLACLRDPLLIGRGE